MYFSPTERYRTCRRSRLIQLGNGEIKISKFEKAFRLFALNPRLLLPYPLLSEELLFYRVERLLMACVKLTKGIAVLTIIHASRDLDTLIPELAPSLKDELIVLLKKIGW